MPAAIEFDREVSVLQGYLLAAFKRKAGTAGHEGGGGDVERLAINGLISELGRFDGTGSTARLHRKLHLFLFANLDLGPQQRPDFVEPAFVGAVSPLSLRAYLKLVHGLNHWHFLLEAGHCLGADDLQPILGPAIDFFCQQKQELDLYTYQSVLTGMTCLCCLVLNKNTQALLEKVLKNFASITSLSLSDGEASALSVLNTLLVLRLVYDLSQGVNVNDEANWYGQKAEGFRDLYHCLDQHVQLGSNMTDVLVQLRKSLLANLKTRLQTLDLLTWVSWAEVGSERLAGFSEVVPYWPLRQDFPSNLQLINAHWMSELQDRLTADQQLGPQHGVLVQVLASMAAKYDRKVELNLDDMEMADLITALDVDTDWKHEAYMSQLIYSHLQEVLQNQDFVSVLVKYSASLVDHFDEILLATSESEAMDANVRSLVLDVFEKMAPNCKIETAKKYFEVNGFSKRLRRPTYELDFVSVLNRSSGLDVSSAGDEMAGLLLQDAGVTLNQLCEVGCLHRGEVELVANILMYLDPCLGTEGRDIVLDFLVENILTKVVDKSWDNNCRLLLQLSKMNALYGAAFISRILTSFWDMYLGRSQHLLPLFGVLNNVSDTAVLGMLPEATLVKLRLMLTQLVIADGYFDHMTNVQLRQMGAAKLDKLRTVDKAAATAGPESQISKSVVDLFPSAIMLKGCPEQEMSALCNVTRRLPYLLNSEWQELLSCSAAHFGPGSAIGDLAQQDCDNRDETFALLAIVALVECVLRFPSPPQLEKQLVHGLAGLVGGHGPSAALHGRLCRAVLAVPGLAGCQRKALSTILAAGPQSGVLTELCAHVLMLPDSEDRRLSLEMLRRAASSTD